MPESRVAFQAIHKPALTALPPLALYVHFPWCVRKCPYCDFNSQAFDNQALPERRYMEALLCDLQATLPQVWGRSVHSVFIGGGTPSLITPDGLASLLSQLRALLPLDPGCEITLEANPGTFEKNRYRAFRDAGVNRLSLGVQSFNDAMLKVLGRIHDAKQARAAIEEVKKHFDNFNLDLMYALPKQDLKALQADLDAALAFSPPHLSLYHLTLEPNTYFAKYPPPVPDDDLAAQMLDLVTERTDVAGLQRYEVSAYAQAGKQCLHNRNYWTFGDYVGIGAGAHGKISFHDRVTRQVKHRDPELYMQAALKGNATAQEREVSTGELVFEFMLGALRLKDGVPLALFAEHTGLSPLLLRDKTNEAIVRGLMTGDPLRLQASAIGFDFLSDLQELFLP